LKRFAGWSKEKEVDEEGDCVSWENQCSRSLALKQGEKQNGNGINDQPMKLIHAWNGRHLIIARYYTYLSAWRSHGFYLWKTDWHMSQSNYLNALTEKE